MLVTVAVLFMMAIAAQAQTLTISKVARVNLQGDPGATYRVLYNTNLSSSDGWQILQHATADKGGQVSVVDESGETRFYRTEKVDDIGPLSVMLNAEPSWAYLRDAKDEIVASYSVTAGAKAMHLTSIRFRFDKRLWLYAKAISILDGSTVLVSKYNLSAADFSELSVGTSYDLFLPITDFYQIGQNQTKQLAILLHAYDVEDRPPTTLNVMRFETRATDSATATMNVSAETDLPRMFLYKGIVGQVVATLSATSPLPRLVQISQTAQTDNVLLGKFDLKSEKITGTLEQIVFGINIMEQKIVPVTDLFEDVKISMNGHTYSADTFELLPGADFSGYAAFYNMNEVLPADQTVTVSVFGKVKPNTTGQLNGAKIAVSLTTSTSPILSNNPEVGDGAYQPIDVVPAILQTSTVIFSSVPVVASGLSATSTPIVVNNEVVAHAAQFSFTLTAGNDTIYVSRTSGFMVTAHIDTIFSSVTKSAGVDVAGDTADYYVVPAGGYRTFTVAGTITKVGGAGVKIHPVQISNLSSGSNPNNLWEYQITYGLEALKLEPVF